MTIRFVKVSIVSFAILVVGMLAVVALPRSASAEAGSGGGGGSSGCAAYNYSTCYGAVWRYFTTGSNSVPIPNVGGGNTYVTNCASTGGFFAYVLVSRNGNGGIRSWKIGPVDGDSGNRSIFFGGWTNYRVYSNPSDPIPSQPVNGADYSWYSAQKAFAQTVALGQGNGYRWDGNSALGWFCYRGLDFNLTPTISGSPTELEGNGMVNLLPTVKNDGPTTSSNVNYRVVSFAIAPNVTPKGAGIGSQEPAAYYGNGATNIVDSYRSFAKETKTLPSTHTVGDYPLGTRVCFALSVKPYRQQDSVWRYSDPFCITILKKPKVQILGNDLFVGKEGTSKIVTSATTKNVSGTNRTYGSWGEYAIGASGTINSMASGGGYSGGSPSSALCDASLLTFTADSATCTTSTAFGSYTVTKALPDMSSRLIPTATITGTSVDLSTMNKSVYKIENAGNSLDVSASSSIGKGRWVIINAPDATVNIKSNINYTSAALQSITDIPQIVIIANNINIDAGVTNVDAWLIASGSNGNLNTCAEITNPTTQLNATKCTAQLTVNGPVVARHLYLYRTGGAGQGAQTGTPSEIFNLRPDAYLWATGWASAAGKLQSVYTNELPPRF